MEVDQLSHAPANAITEPLRRSHWEEFIVHRHETQLQLQTLLEGREQQRLSDARAHMEVDQLSHAIDICSKDIGALRQQHEEEQARLAKLACTLEHDHEGIDTIRRGLNRLERALREQGEQHEQQIEALTSTMKRGDRGVADELLMKMAELNEKLGANMQSLEEELAADLQMIAERVDQTLVATHPASAELVAARASAHQSAATAADAATRASAAELSLDETRARMDRLMLETRADLRAAAEAQAAEVREQWEATLATSSNQGAESSDRLQDATTELQRGLSEVQTLCEELQMKIAAEAATSRTCTASVTEELRSACCDLHRKFEDVRSSTDDACNSMGSKIRDELQARLD